MNALQQIIPKPGKNDIIEFNLNRGYHNVTAHLDGDAGDVSFQGLWPT